MKQPTALAALAFAISAATQAGSPATQACQTEQLRHDRVHLRCAWPAGARQVELRARFAGSHDDTSASLVAQLDGAPLACGEGSKTTIDGQDEGEVTMSCRLSAPPSAPAGLLRFELRWYHARYTGFDLLVD